MDPIGLSLEHFDYLGRWRQDYGKAVAKRNGRDAAKIRVTAVLPDGTRYEGAKGLKQYLIKNSDRFRHCLIEKLMVFSLGRRLAFTDQDDVKQLVESDFTGLRDLVTAVVLSEPFRSK